MSHWNDRSSAKMKNSIMDKVTVGRQELLHDGYIYGLHSVSQ